MEAGMHVQVVTYRLTDADVSDDDFVAANQEFAEMMNAVPGLLAKVWLKNADAAGAYGGLYLWQDHEAYEGFLASGLWESVVSDDAVSDLESRDFSVMDGLTQNTHPDRRSPDPPQGSVIRSYVRRRSGAAAGGRASAPFPTRSSRSCR